MSTSLSKRRYDFSELLRVAHPDLTPAQVHRGWQQLLGLRLARLHRPRRARWLVAGAIVVALTLLIGFQLGRRFSGKPLKYAVTGGSVSEDGRILGDKTRPTALQFSDGSSLSLASGGEGRVLSVNHVGARVRVVEGELKADVGQSAESAWELDAGPYDVLASEASFWMRWQEREQLLELAVRSGLVNVEGPLANDGLGLHAGQRLSVRKGESAIIARSDAEDVEELASHAAAPRPSEAQGSALGFEQLLNSGKAAELLATARGPAIDVVLRTADSADLLALAEAARSARDAALAERALRGVRARFAETGAARDAAFLLGQLFESRSGSVVEAEEWYATYLAEAPNGSYAAEALGRRMLLALQRNGRDGALELAREYLNRYPAGHYAPSARAVLAL